MLIPQHNLVLASRGSAQCFLKIYELCLKASFRADFTMEQLMAELGLVMDHLWPYYLQAAVEAGMTRDILHSELVAGGRLLVADLRNGQAIITDVAAI